MGVGSLIGGIFSANAQSDSAKKAARASENAAALQAETVKEIYRTNRADLMPFLDAGKEALRKIQRVDVTGGADQYLQDLLGLTFPSDVDPTGGVQKYIDQIDNLDFKFDPNDPVYLWRQKENERQVNQFYASRGGYDSRAALNVLTDTGMQLQSQEIGRQYQQNYLDKFNKLVAEAGLATQKGQLEYGAAKDKYGADVAKNLNAINASLSTGGAKYNSVLDLIKIGTGAGASAGAQGSQVSNQLTNIYGQNSQNQQNAILQSGAAQAALYNSIGQEENKALSYYLAFGGGGGGG